MNDAKAVVGIDSPDDFEETFFKETLDNDPSQSNHAREESNEDTVSAASDTNAIALPGRVANAIVNIYDGLTEFKLLENHRRVLSCLVRFGVRLSNPRAHIFIKKATIASKLNVNEATVYRCLSALEEKGLIQREPQDRTGPSLKVIGRVYLTELALARLGLVANVRANHKTIENGSVIVGNNHIARVQDVNSEAFKQSSSKKQPLRASFEELEGKKIPADLTWLHRENQLSVTGLLRLMRLARESGKRLSDIVSSTRAALTPLQGRELFAYLRALAGKTVDFAATASKAREREQQASEKKAKDARVVAQLASLRKMAGQTFRTPDNVLLTIEDAGFYARRGDTLVSLGSVPFTMSSPAITAILSGSWAKVDTAALAASQQLHTASKTKSRPDGWAQLSKGLTSRFARAFTPT
ncbi:helix-turn-helix domain-containing protein [Paraburkholderia sp. WP4_3_2]|uniref:helix-turn-helix domain-containing protein n=1 Tax=Paraburkholderia sp. WP4_3_2 TaxID=2587162 RepID=UPI001611A8D0|nr:helix-turn-helix domain-containing protein [Paraburkholderia sp. WP4_3_2]MBB3261278.1 DNA-binding MarR family transcriptional regulator [Paraburkholderia sp. WP4_3_2]